MNRFVSWACGIVLAALMLTLLGATPTRAAEKGPVKLCYVEWSCATASTHVCKAVIEEKLGYEVEVTPVSAAVMWQAISTGDQDAMTTAWLPVTHEDYFKKTKENIVDLGPNLEGAGLFLVVPKYVAVDSIAQINENADKFDKKIIGIDPGAGLMKKAEEAIKKYKMDKMELIEGSGAAMTAALKNAIERKEWIVVTGWAPHWKYARWQLKNLEDPKGVFGGKETINTIVRKGLKKDMPDVYMFLDNFHWTMDDIGEVMAMNAEEGADPSESAKKWVADNPEKVKAWFKGFKK